MTPAEELRTAAAKLRTLTKAIDAPDLPDQSWHTEACANEDRSDCPCIVAQGRYSYHDEPQKPLYYVADAETPECAAYIATMGPPVGNALADWLENTATSLAASTHPGWQEYVAADAVAVARAINGGHP